MTRSEPHSDDPTPFDVLLIHGLNGSPAEMRLVANGLSREGYRVQAMTLAGHGGNAEAVASMVWREWYQSAEQELLKIAQEGRQTVIAGLSSGGVIGLMLAANHPDKICAVAVYSPMFWLSGGLVPWYAHLLERGLPKRIASLLRIPVPDHLGIKDDRIRDFILNARGPAGMSATSGSLWFERRRMAEAAIPLLETISQPVLIMHARDDDYAGLDNATYLARALKGWVSLVILEDCYHMMTVDRQRNQVVSETVEFLARVSGRACPAYQPRRAAE